MKLFSYLATMIFFGFSVPSVAQVVMETDDNAATLAGTWTQSNTIPGFYGNDFAIAQGGGTADMARFFSKKPISSTGSWCVEARWTAVANRTTAAAYQVYDGATLRNTFKVNQRLNGGVWLPLGCVTLTAGKTSEVRLTDSGLAASDYVVADGVRWVWEEKTLYQDFQDYCIAVNGGFSGGGTTFVGKSFAPLLNGTCRPWSGIVKTATTVVGTSIGTACLSTDGKLFTLAVQSSLPEFVGPGQVATDHIELCPLGAADCPAHNGQSDQGSFAGPAAHVTCNPLIVPIPSSHD